MLSKNQIKLIKSLGLKKNRAQFQLFTVEGFKGISEFLKSPYNCRALYTTNDQLFNGFEAHFISKSELKRISQLKSPSDSLAVFEIPGTLQMDLSGLVLVLDDIKDPGNLGTIIRLADWFGVSGIICSPETVDCYNPKVVQSSMGSLARISVHYKDLIRFVKSYEGDVYGTFLEGASIYKTSFQFQAALVLGNEANGISKELETLISKKITIPQYGEKRATESLNVATATAICLGEIRRTTGRQD
jgi:TrmH family RNA methyltransferase